jgi:putative ABC transport system ATP-binding protein
MEFPMSENQVVALSDVRKEYMLGETKVEALRGVSVTVDKGEFMAIAGSSGSGKSTILNMIGCIDSQWPVDRRLLP